MSYDGMWLKDSRGLFYCSECGYKTNVLVSERGTSICPSCGAIMELDSEELSEEKQFPATRNRECKLARHKNICDEIKALYERKNHDYGDSFGQSFQDYGILAGIIRMEDKFNRLKKLARGGEQKVMDESIRDTLIDLANYSIMTVLELEGSDG